MWKTKKNPAVITKPRSSMSLITWRFPLKNNSACWFKRTRQLKKKVANVRWNGKNSKDFRMTNGCRQGAILSAIAYCFYCEGLFVLLKRRRAGCWVESTYCGIFGYSDDNWVLAPSLDSLQNILTTCQEYAASHNLKFSTDPNSTKCKTKCLAFLKKKRVLPELLLCGNPLPWVDKLKHLGN